MQDVYDLLTLGLAQFDQGVLRAVGYLSGASGPIGLLGYLPPLLLVLLSRQPLHVAIALILTAATLAVLRLDEAALGLSLYAAVYVVAAHGFVAARTRRQTGEAAAQMARLHLEVTTFLDGLDRRSRVLDQTQAATPEPRNAPEREQEAA